MALCRWRSPEALRAYARLSFEEYVEWLRRAEAAEPQSIQGPNVPDVGVAQLPRPELRTPGALRAEAYDLHARALEAPTLLIAEPPQGSTPLDEKLVNFHRQVSST